MPLTCFVFMYHFIVGAGKNKGRFETNQTQPAMSTVIDSGTYIERLCLTFSQVHL